jgi:MFS transporter, DHA2 family, methylenomycin A resistance protein
MPRLLSPGWALCATSFGFAAVQLDVTIVNVALPRIAVDLGAATSALQWVVDAYTLAFAVLLLSAGALVDRFGARRIYLAGFALFGVASASCALADTPLMLVLTRGVQGVGAACLVPSSLALLAHVYAHDERARARAVGWWTAAGGVSIAAGPLIGGLLLAVTDWRAIFWVNLPICVVGVLLTLQTIQEAAPVVNAKRRALDPLGQLLAILALTGLTGAVIEGAHAGAHGPWVGIGYVLALVAGLAFVRVEARSAAPMLPLSLFHAPSFTPAVYFGMAANLTYYGTLFVLSLYLQQVLELTPLQTGLAYLPLTATFIVSNIISGRLAAHHGPRWPMVLGGLMGATGFILLLRLDAHSNALTMLLPFVLIPGGMGLGVPAMTGTVLACVPRELAGTATAVLNAARQTAGAIGVAVFGALLDGGAGAIVRGLHISASLSALLLVSAAVAAALGISRGAVRLAAGR